MLVRRQTSVIIVRRAEIVLVDAARGEAAMPRRRLSIRRRRIGDRRERAGGRAEDRPVRLDAGRRGRHTEGDLGVAGRALGHDAVTDGLARLRRRRVLLALQHLDEGLGGLERVTRQERSLVVHGHGDLPDAGGLVEGRGTTVAIRHPAADGLLVEIRLDLDESHGLLLLLLLVRLVLRRDDW